jgi:hypothetical protein
MHFVKGDITTSYLKSASMSSLRDLISKIVLVLQQFQALGLKILKG